VGNTDAPTLNEYLERHLRITIQAASLEHTHTSTASETEDRPLGIRHWIFKSIRTVKASQEKARLRVLLDRGGMTGLTMVVKFNLLPSVTAKLFGKKNLALTRPFDLQQLASLWHPDSHDNATKFMVESYLHQSSSPKLILKDVEPLDMKLRYHGLATPGFLLGPDMLFSGTLFATNFWRSGANLEIRWVNGQAVEGTVRCLLIA
jgi:hypothetical protein